MEELRVEYLIKVDGSKTLCNSMKTFENLLKISSEIELESDVIKYKNIDINYNNKKYLNEDRENVFDLEVYINNIENISEFEAFLRELKSILYKISDNILILQDDISLYYSVNTYPIFNEVENLMRKLLTKFMVIKVGENWDKDNIPKKVKKSIESSKRKDSYSFLYRADFIDLSKFLFDKYSIKTLQDFSKESLSGKEVNKEDYIEKSNWERYFSDILKYEDGELQKQWSEMYELRCKIAHNNKFTKEDSKKVLNIYKKIKPVLIDAINKIDDIVIGLEERKVFTESIIGNGDVLLGVFVKKLRELENKINEIYCKKSGDNEYRAKSMYSMIRIIRECTSLGDEVFDDIEKIIRTRNEIFHGVRSIKDSELQEKIDDIERIIRILDGFTK
ncbi:hypothetical protein ELS18_08470 [Clostridium perfringens]|uniref:HEPN domain-containing protein n=1 Tax=Clostridium perfringens TaxID=1502 RepID=UPI000F8E9AFC|nr:HEPN domain-containing protein [Clostridium perfringens]RUR38047.1 hypothetical protein ELS18_08470 [Clostridium perfringens]